MSYSNQYRSMRLFVSFDLPTQTNEEKKCYRDFRTALLNEGFTMMQYSVYIRFCQNDTEKAKFVRHIKKIAPLSGNVRMYWLTERQYQNMFILTGGKTNNERIIGKKPLIVFE
ncbi:MAG: CRISPR-associated endonuclease Cas2 [Culicoidibacterales bacterium]